MPDLNERRMVPKPTGKGLIPENPRPTASEAPSPLPPDPSKRQGDGAGGCNGAHKGAGGRPLNPRPGPVAAPLAPVWTVLQGPRPAPHAMARALSIPPACPNLTVDPSPGHGRPVRPPVSVSLGPPVPDQEEAGPQDRGWGTQSRKSHSSRGLPRRAGGLRAAPMRRESPKPLTALQNSAPQLSDHEL